MSESQNESESVLPANCKYVEVGKKYISVPVDGDEEWLSEPDFEHMEVEDKGHRRHTTKEVSFEAGDHLPLPVAERVFSAYRDRLILKNGNHELISRGKNVDFENSERIH